MSPVDEGELPSETALRYLENAEQARAQARTTSDPKMREVYLMMATSWERMAVQIDWYTKL